MNLSQTLGLFAVLLTCSTAFAAERIKNSAEKIKQVVKKELAIPSKKAAEWGIAITYRSATVPYANVTENSVTSLVPMLFYQGDYVFLNGLEAGIHAWKNQDWQINALARTRFFDVPSEYQNQAGGDTADFGFQIKRLLKKDYYAQTDFMLDDAARFHAITSLGKRDHKVNYVLDAKISARFVSPDFNSHYYGLDGLIPNGVSLKGGVDFSATLKGRYHLVSNLYLMGSFGMTYLNKAARHASTIHNPWQSEFFAGFGFFNDKLHHGSNTHQLKPYLRFSHGFATSSNMGDILTGNTVSDPNNNQLSSLFYGYPLSDELFGLPIDLYLSPGVAWHWQSDVQDPSVELITAIKAYYTLDWPFKWRLGVAEGLSYINEVTYIENKELTEKGYKPNSLLNYLDLSLDVNVGDMLNIKTLNNIWLGYSMHHRSAIFETSSQFGRMKGGSNYNTIYLQIDI